MGMVPQEFPPDKCHEAWFNTWPCPSCCCLPCNSLCHPLRRAVSRKKVRYRQDGFNLDLVYVTPRIIVMGFPATGVEHFYRNPRYEVRRFLESRHRGNYKVFNFCCEPGRAYDPAVFGGRVERYPFPDHGVPDLTCLMEATNSAKAWLDEHPDHVVAFHCKAGKGRAGVMVSCLLLRTGECQTAESAVEYYNQRRVRGGRGLTLSSQIKCVHRYEDIWRQVWGVPRTRDLGAIPALSFAKTTTTSSAPSDNLTFILPSQGLMGLKAVDLSRLSGLEKFLRLGTFTKLYVKAFHAGGPSCRQMLLGTTDVQSPSEGYYFVFQEAVQVQDPLSFKESTMLRLWENTAFLAAGGPKHSFGCDVLDMRRAVRRRLPNDFTVYLEFGSGRSQDERTTISPVHGIAASTCPVVVSAEGSSGAIHSCPVET